MDASQLAQVMALMNGTDDEIWQRRRPSPALGLPERLEAGFSSIQEAAVALEEAGITQVIRVQVSISPNAQSKAKTMNMVKAMAAMAAPAAPAAPVAPATDSRIEKLESQLQQLITLQAQALQSQQPAPPPGGGDPNNP